MYIIIHVDKVYFQQNICMSKEKQSLETELLKLVKKIK